MNTLTASQVVKQMTARRTSLVRFSQQTIVGTLDLRDKQITRPVQFTRCYFLGPVLFEGTVFTERIEISKSTFVSFLRGGGIVHGHSEARAGMLLRWNTFIDSVDLSYLKCDGILNCEGSRFIGGKEVNLAHVSLETACFDHCYFQARTSFHSMTAKRSLSFRRISVVSNCRFDFSFATADGDVHFDGARFGCSADFSNSRFRGTLSFQHAHFQWPSPSLRLGDSEVIKNLAMAGAHFAGEADFSGLRCSQSGLFRGCKFDGVTNFTFARFDQAIDLAEATLEGQVDFTRLQCTIGYFSEAKFYCRSRKPETFVVDFSHALFEGEIECAGAEFAGATDFVGMQCGYGKFSNTSFQESVRFWHCSCTGGLNFTDAVFNGNTSFHGIKSRSAVFERAKFLNAGSLDFAFVDLDTNFRCENATFAGPVDFCSARVGETMNLAGAQFSGPVSLVSTWVKRLELGDTLPFSENVDLRGFRFEHFDTRANAISAVWMPFVMNQPIQSYSRDAFIALEQCLRRQGDDEAADKIYYVGRKKVRNMSRNRDAPINWSTERRIADTLQQWLNHYGVRNRRLAVLIGLWIGIGTFVFWSNGAVLVRLSDNPRETSNTSIEQPASSGVRKVVERLAFSTDLFIPVVKLQLTENWRPAPGWREIYAAFHRLVGWFLVPLFLASISGLIKRE